MELRLVAPTLKSEDVLVLLKLAVWNSQPWSLPLLSEELGPTPEEIQNSIRRLRTTQLVCDISDRLFRERFKEFVLYCLQYMFPTRPGMKTKGMLTGAKTHSFFKSGSPQNSIYVWTKAGGSDYGYEIEALSPHCCYAALNDTKLRSLLSITETMRIVGTPARLWAASELDRSL